MLSSPLSPHILSYEPPRDFVMLSFAMYDGSTDSYDHKLHFNQTMILSARNDRLLCKVFPASLKRPALAWFHKPRIYKLIQRIGGSVHFRISLQATLKQEDESIRDFTRRFGQAIQQIDIYSIDTILQNFRRSFEPTTPFFQSLSLDPLATIEELYRRADKYSTLEDNIQAASQTVMIIAQNSKATTKGQPEQKGSQNKNQKLSQEQSEKKRGSLHNSPFSTSLMIGSYLSSEITLILNGPHQ